MSFQPPPGTAFYRTLLFFKLTLNYPVSDNPKFLRIHWISNVFLKLFTLFNLFGVCVHLVVSLRQRLFIILFEDFALAPSYVGTVSACVLFCYRHRTWAAWFRRTLDFEKFGKPHNFDEVAKRFNSVSTAVYCYSYFATTLYIYVRLTDTAYCEEVNRKYGIHETCGLIAPIWWPTELTSRVKNIIVFFQIISIWLVAPGCVLIVFPTEAVELMKSRADHCKEMFQSIFDDDKINILDRNRKKNYSEKLDFCIEYHIELSCILEDFRAAFKSSLWWCSATATVVIACILTEVIKTNNWASIARGVSWIAGVFMVCRAGQTFQDLLTPISEAVYCSKWYEADIRTRKKLLFVMKRSQKPIVLDAMPCGDHNYNLFLKLAKACYSCLMLMNQGHE